MSPHFIRLEGNAVTMSLSDFTTVSLLEVCEVRTSYQLFIQSALTKMNEKLLSLNLKKYVVLLISP